ncbi:hypothetical protein PQX77_005080 [Marasmius sp. AFHP31]|nr:hypothetical protein PQX77_005080 [Marasmius sp. AFHP31]
MNRNSFPVCDAVENCPIGVDVVIRSSDGILFGAHTKNLELFSESFPDPDGFKSTRDERIPDIVDLVENAATIRLFLTFTHNGDHRALLDTLSLTTLIELTGVADKYGNHFALGMCLMAIDKIATQPRISGLDCLKILLLKSSCDHLYAIDLVARRALSVPLPQAIPYFQDNLETYMFYTQYRDQWRECTINFQAILKQAPRISKVSRNSPEAKITNAIRFLKSTLETAEFPTHTMIDDGLRISEAWSVVNVSTDTRTSGWIRKLRAAIDAFPRWSRFQS